MTNKLTTKSQRQVDRHMLMLEELYLAGKITLEEYVMHTEELAEGLKKILSK